LKTTIPMTNNLTDMLSDDSFYLDPTRLDRLAIIEMV